MEKLVPYTVHLPADLHKRLKEAAGERRAAALVREALTLYLGEQTPYRAGVSAGLRQAKEEIMLHPLLCSLKWKDETLAQNMCRLLENKDA